MKKRQVLLFLLLILALTACTANAATLAGTYSGNWSGVEVSLTFNSGKVVQVSNGETYEGTYKLDGDDLQLDFSGQSVSYIYNSSEDKIELEGPLGNYSLTKE